jgi:hypothetical protein
LAQTKKAPGGFVVIRFFPGDFSELSDKIQACLPLIINGICTFLFCILNKKGFKGHLKSAKELYPTDASPEKFTTN